MTRSESSCCFHCGETIVAPLAPIEHEDHVFCCQGCVQVYSIIKGQGLDRYYQLDDKAGIRASDDDEASRALLDDQLFFRRYVAYEDDQQWKVLWSCPQIHCRACVWLLEKMPEWCDDVTEARVDVLKRTLSVTLNKRTSNLERDSVALTKSESPTVSQARSIADRLAQMGYAPDLSRRPHVEDQDQDMQKQDWLRIGVAGFCFGNVMLFSFPEYLSSGDLSEGFQHLFRYLSAIISLPVVFYCSRGILLKGVKSLRWQSMDVDVPITLGLGALFFWSWYEVLSSTGPGYFDSLCGLVFFLLTGRSFQKNSFKNLVFEKDEHRFFPLSITRVKSNASSNTESLENIQLSELKEGDIFELANGSMIPTESIIVSGEAKLDYRLVTGESDVQVHRAPASVFAGGIQRGGRLRLKATCAVRESSLAYLWAGGERETGRIISLLDQIGRYFTLVVMLLASMTLWLWWPEGIGRALEVTCAVLIIACPCALALSAPLTLGMALRELAKVGCYVKNTKVIEALSKVDLVVFDKTGTLTCVDESSGSWLGDSSEQQRQWVRTLATHSNHPVAVAMVASGENTDVAVANFHEEAGLGMEAQVDGHWIKVGRPSWVSKQEPSEDISYTEIMIDGVSVDRFAQRLKMREGIHGILKCWPKHVEKRLLSGDHDMDRSRLRDYFDTDYVVGHVHIAGLGWNGCLTFGILYYLVPKLYRTKLHSQGLASLHFWLATLGIILYGVSLYFAGLTQGMMWMQFDESGDILKYPNFLETVIEIMPMYYIRAVGGLLYFTGVLVMAYNLIRTGMNGSFNDNDTAIVPVRSGPLDTSHGIHRRLEGLPGLFTILSVLAILVGGLVELVPSIMQEVSEPTVAMVKPYTPLELEGRDIYRQEGCVNCHSQMIRPFRAETERYGAYGEPGDYVYEHPFLWGSRRIGPDLQRVGKRLDLTSFWHYNHMIDPQAASPGSIMPPYPWLAENKLNQTLTRAKMKAMQTLGVPYTDDQINSALWDLQVQAESIAKELHMADQNMDPEDWNREIIALIAYLKALGHRVEPPTGPVVEGGE